jgi:hypothetical protein
MSLCANGSGSPSKPSGSRTSSGRRPQNEPRAGIELGVERPSTVPLSIGNIFTQARVSESSVCAESVMPLSTEQEELCRRLEMGRPEPSAATLIRQQARDIDELWDRLSRAYLAVRREIPTDELRQEIKCFERSWQGGGRNEEGRPLQEACSGIPSNSQSGSRTSGKCSGLFTFIQR